MIQISPEQRIYTAIRRICKELGYSVYDYLPDSKAGFPFVVLGEQFSQNIREHKSHLNKRTQVTVHFWHNDWRKRGSLTKMMRDVELGIISEFKVNGEDISTQILPDNSTGSDLYHGILETDIRI